MLRTQDNCYSCPICKTPLKVNGANFSCSACQRKWETYEGILDFSDHDFYWNQVPKEDMKQIIKEALNGGWQNAITQFFGNQRKYLQNYIIDESRADWHFYIPLGCEAKVLDIGAGWGAVSIALARNYKIVFAADSTLENLEFLNIRAQQENSKNLIPIRINPLDYPKFPFASSFFDLVVLNGVLEWVGGLRLDTNPYDLQKQALQEIAKILKPSGYVYIGIENRYALSNFLGARPHGELPFTSILPRRIADLLTKLVEKKPHRTYVHSPRNYYSLLKGAGFDLINFYWTIPSYRFPTVIIPLHSDKVLKYWRGNMMTSGTTIKRWIKRILFTILPQRIYCENFGIIARKARE